MEENKTVRLPVVLKGSENYLLWARTAKAVLCGRKLWSHVESSAPPVVEAKEGGKGVVAADSEWFNEDQSVLAILHGSLSLSVLEAYSYCEGAKELWDTLKNVFGNVSNLTRVFEVKKALNSLSQGDMEFNEFFGKFRSLWAGLEMLRPTTLEASVLNERREQDKVFALLMVLNPAFNDLIKHLLRADKLPSLDEVCSQIQKEQGAVGLFGSKGELVTANQVEVASVNKGYYRSDNKNAPTCEHCKMVGHTKERCWTLHPHLKPRNAGNRRPRAHQVSVSNEARTSEPNTQIVEGNALAASSEFVRKSDLDALIKALKESSGNAPLTLKTNKPLIVDSGASHHMISDSNLMSEIKPALGNVVVANGYKVPVKGVGNLKLFDKKSEAFYMPSFTSNLLSVKRATTDLNCLAIFSPNDVLFQDIETSKVLGKGSTKDDLYVLKDLNVSTGLSACFNSVISKVNSSIWHARLGHPHSRALELMLPSVSFKNDECEACILGKHCKSVFPKSSTIYEHCFDLVHSDVWTSPCLSRENQKYFVTFIDEKSKYTWITLLPSKDRVLEAFTNFQNYVTNHYNAKIKILRSDNGGEYTSHAFKQHLAKHGIIHQTSCPYTPQQNGVAERKNRHLMEVARSMMFHTNVPKEFWGDAVLAACYLINRTPTKILRDVSPFEVLTKDKPSLNHLRVFGCVCYVLRPGEQRDKLDAKSVKGIFIGYSTTQKGYKCYDPESRRVLVSRDVKFVETQGYYDEKNWESLKDLSTSPSDRATNLRIILEKLGIENTNTDKETSDKEASGQESSEQHEPSSIQEPVNGPIEEETPNIDESSSHKEDNYSETEEGLNSLGEEVTSEDEEYEPTDQEEDGVEIIPRKSTRERRPPSYLQHYNCQAVAHPIQAVCTLAHFPMEHQVFISQVDKHWMRLSYPKARKR